MNACGTCKHFFPYRDPDTKRIHPTKRGSCEWPFPWPAVWPQAFWQDRWNRTPSRPRASGVWNDSGEDCPCWEANDSQESPKHQQTDLHIEP